MAQVNVALACFSLIGGIYLMYAIFKMSHPEGLKEAWSEKKKELEKDYETTKAALKNKLSVAGGAEVRTPNKSSIRHASEF